MHDKSLKLAQLSGVLATLTVASDAFADIGGVVTYGPLAQSVPVLSDLMLVVLGLLVAVMAYRFLRTYPGGQPLATLTALTITGLSMLPGTHFIEQAYAIAAYPMSTHPAGSSVSVNNDQNYGLLNDTSVVQQIKTVTPSLSCAVHTGSTCTPGLVIQPTESCTIRFDCGTT